MKPLATLLVLAAVTFAQSLYISYPVNNATTTGTTINRLFKLDSSGNAVIMSAGDTAGFKGVIIGGQPGVGPNTQSLAASVGVVPLDMDGTATAQHYVQISGTAAGKGHDTGSTAYPTSGGDVVGQVVGPCSGTCTAYVLLAPENPATSGGGFDPLDMTKYTHVYSDGVKTDFYPVGWSVFQQDGATVCGGGGGVTSAGEATGISYDTGATSGNYCTIFKAARDGAAGTAFSDFVSAANFHAFDFRTRLNLPSIVSVKGYWGVFASVTAADPTDGVFLEFDPNGGWTNAGNWQCTVRNGGTSTRTDTGVAATTNYITARVWATASGTLNCSVNGTAVSTAATFPAATFVGGRAVTETTSAKTVTLSNMRLQITFSGH